MFKNGNEYITFSEKQVKDFKLIDSLFRYNKEICRYSSFNLQSKNRDYQNIIYDTCDETLFRDLFKLLQYKIDSIEELNKTIDYFQISGQSSKKILKKYIKTDIKFLNTYLEICEDDWDSSHTINYFDSIEKYFSFLIDNVKYIKHFKNVIFWKSINIIKYSISVKKHIEKNWNII